jgi:glutathione S-transferase
MAIEIFWASGSAYAWRVLLTLEAKGLPYQSHLLEFSKGDHQTPAYLAMNPRGRIPTVRDGEVVVYESIAIMAYLDRRYPGTPLFGETPAEAARIWRVISEAMCYLDTPTEDFILPLYDGRSVEQAAQIRAALPRLHDELRRLEAALGHQPWLAATPALSAADIAVFPLVKSVLRAAGKPGAEAFDPRLLPLTETYPAVAGWLARVETLPGYPRTTPPHWR